MLNINNFKILLAIIGFLKIAEASVVTTTQGQTTQAQTTQTQTTQVETTLAEETTTAGTGTTTETIGTTTLGETTIASIPVCSGNSTDAIACSTAQSVLAEAQDLASILGGVAATTAENIAFGIFEQSVENLNCECSNAIKTIFSLVTFSLVLVLS